MIMIYWKPEGRNKRGRHWRTWKHGIYRALNERDLRMGEWNNRRQWNMKVGRRRQTIKPRNIYSYVEEYLENKWEICCIYMKIMNLNKCIGTPVSVRLLQYWIN
jgi:hypothetical protein